MCIRDRFCREEKENDGIIFRGRGGDPINRITVYKMIAYLGDMVGIKKEKVCLLYTSRQITVIFGAKAAPAYIIAKDIIHLILCLQELIANDPEVAPYLKVVMVENYNVTLAEKLIPAADIHEQISLASKAVSYTHLITAYSFNL